MKKGTTSIKGKRSVNSSTVCLLGVLMLETFAIASRVADFTDSYEVEWLEKGQDVSSLAGKTLRVVFELHGAKLYAMQFQQVPNTSAATLPPAASGTR